MVVSFAAKLRRGSVHARRHGLVVLISNVFAYHLRVQEAITANAAMPLVAGEDVRTPLGAFRVVFGIGHFNNQPSASVFDAIITRSRRYWSGNDLGVELAPSWNSDPSTKT